MKCSNHIILLGMGYEAWLKCRNEDAYSNQMAYPVTLLLTRNSLNFQDRFDIIL